VKVAVEKSFSKDVNKIRNKKVLLEVQKIINSLEKSSSINEIPHTKKIEGYSSYYRIRIGDYRLGFEKYLLMKFLLLDFYTEKTSTDTFHVNKNIIPEHFIFKL
jgi:mRNA interferase RelE/StbE